MNNISIENIRTYFDTLFSYCEGWIPLRSFAESNNVEPQPPHNIWIENNATAVSKAITFARWADSQGYAFYVIPSTVAENGQASAGDVQQMQTLLIDLDIGDIKGKCDYLVRHLGKPTLTVESGGITPEGQHKLHLYWKLSEPAECEELKKLIECRYLIAIKAGGDTHFKSAHQPIRVAGSVYRKLAEGKAVRIVEANDYEYHLDELREIILEMPSLTGDSPSTRKNNPLDFNDAEDMKVEVSELLTTTVHEGGVDGITRFESLSSVIGHFIRLFHNGDISHEEAWEGICEHNEKSMILSLLCVDISPSCKNVPLVRR